MKFAGVALRNFRSIGRPGVDLYPWKKCNLLVGQNNSGKSNVLKGLLLATETARSFGRSNPTVPFGELSTYRHQRDTPFEFALHFEVPQDSHPWNRLGVGEITFEFSLLQGHGPTLAGSTLHTLDDGQRLPDETDQAFLQRWIALFSALTDRRFPRAVNSGVLREEFARHAAGIFQGHFQEHIPTVEIIPEFRRIQSAESYTLSGNNLIKVLAEYQHPEEGKHDLQDRFEKIEGFVQRLLHLPDAKLEVTHDATDILLSTDGLRLSLFSYGTGVHELTILLTAVLSRENAVFCIEEPEIHLHPRLQRELIEFLTEETEADYVLSSHSGALINSHVGYESFESSPIQVFHISSSEDGTESTPVFTDDHVLMALDDLGIRASDILQANSVVWVEGPSDRIFLNSWLALTAPDLVEGLHYAVMFYGGRLLSHLTIDRNPHTEDLVRLLRINQHAVVVMDSDLKTSDRRRRDGNVNDTKLRIKQEVEDAGGIAWITHGREIENYIPNSLWNRLCEHHFNASANVNLDRFGSINEALSTALGEASRVDASKRIPDVKYSSNKVVHARRLCQLMQPEDVGEALRDQLDSLASTIRNWND